MPKHFISKGGGFIGLSMIDFLIGMENDLVGDLLRGCEKNIYSNLKYIKLSVCDYKKLSPFLG